MATFLIARQILALPLPELKVAEQHTTSSALHDINFVVADEHGIQGRFAERIGQALGAISADEGTGIYFADARAAPLQSTGIPDMVVMNQRSLT
ncbi:hypothetical protein N7493_004133 [Penicillium malachiteum]|uniref:Uncharacterized protein n=1 Tax=Penicillium malachiteum TaxID=1324776 RepID=A0AAD6MY45_9EURO|nr:hypothetical protein N7493_004133 [Penicillium malachiteum]